MSKCLMCGRGLSDLCETPEECSANEIQVSRKHGNRDALDSLASGRPSIEGEKRKRGRPYKSDSDIVDPKSTGRKRAAILYPIDKNKPCDFRGLANVGGGKHPIVGCIEGFQEERHHGPDKNTLNNDPGNVHLICDDCHNIWHSQNDKDYPAEEIQSGSYLHEPRPALERELVLRQFKMAFKVSDAWELLTDDERRQLDEWTNSTEDFDNGSPEDRQRLPRDEFGIVIG